MHNPFDESASVAFYQKGCDFFVRDVLYPFCCFGKLLFFSNLRPEKRFCVINQIYLEKKIKIY